MKTDPREWWWIDTNQNITDLTIRPCTPKKTGMDSVWQNDPNFLPLPVKEWSIKQQCEDQLTNQIGIAMSMVKRSRDITNLDFINVDRFNSYSKLLKVTCRIKAAFRCKPFKRRTHN